MSAYPLIGEIMVWGGYFAPYGWAFCDGQIMSIYQNEALYSLLWNTYGGDGISTFALPDLRGRIPMGLGTGTGLTARNWGDQGGAETVTLDTAQIADAEEPDATLSAAGTETGSVPVMPSALTLNFVICLQGEYPCRD